MKYQKILYPDKWTAHSEAKKLAQKAFDASRQFDEVIVRQMNDTIDEIENVLNILLLRVQYLETILGENE